MLEKGWTGRAGVKFVGSKDIGDRRQSVVGLYSWHMMDMGGLRQVRLLVIHLSGRRVGFMSTSEGLIQGR